MNLQGRSARVGSPQQFFADGVLRASVCRACGAASFPPRADCPRCLDHRIDWKAISDRCVLATFTIIHSPPAGFDHLKPLVIGVADLDDGGRLMGWIVGVEPSKIAIGMRLRVKPAPDGLAGQELPYVLTSED